MIRHNTFSNRLIGKEKGQPARGISQKGQALHGSARHSDRPATCEEDRTAAEWSGPQESGEKARSPLDSDAGGTLENKEQPGTAVTSVVPGCSRAGIHVSSGEPSVADGALSALLRRRSAAIFQACWTVGRDLPNFFASSLNDCPVPSLSSYTSSACSSAHDRFGSSTNSSAQKNDSVTPANRSGSSDVSRSPASDALSAVRLGRRS